MFVIHPGHVRNIISPYSSENSRAVLYSFKISEVLVKEVAGSQVASLLVYLSYFTNYCLCRYLPVNLVASIFLTSYSYSLLATGPGYILSRLVYLSIGSSAAGRRRFV